PTSLRKSSNALAAACPMCQTLDTSQKCGCTCRIRGKAGIEVVMDPRDHYVIITADSHAGGSHKQYREFLDPKYRDDFDAWREKYKNPYKDLKDTNLRVRNWYGELRDEQLHADWCVGDVVVHNTESPCVTIF